jgi:hypothetical protein
MILILLLVFVLGCGGSQTIIYDPAFTETIQYDVYISQNFPPPVDKVIRGSFNEWQSKLHSLIRFDYKDGYINCLKTTYAICVEPVAPDLIQNKAGLTGHSDQLKHAQILISTDAYEPNLLISIVSKHEIGHALGLLHSKKHNTIMYPTGDYVSRSISNDDVNDYLKMRHILK